MQSERVVRQPFRIKRNLQRAPIRIPCQLDASSGALVWQFYPCKNSLAHMLHAPDRDKEERGITVGFKKAAQMTSSLTWAKAQLTRDGKPGCEANRPEVPSSESTGKARPS